MSKTKNPITFAEGVYIREKTFDNGSSVINIDFNAKDFCNFMKEHVNDKGFVTTTIQKSQKALYFAQFLRILVEVRLKCVGFFVF